MKTVKNTFQLTFITLLCGCVIAGWTSCNKNTDNGAVPPARVMVVNTVEGSASQYLYLNNNKVNNSAVAYGQSSPYTVAIAGTDNAQFKNAGSTAANTSFSLTLQPSAYYTVYYTSNGTTNTSFTSQDNLAIPAGNEASVQFINFSTANTSGFDVYIVGASKLITSLLPSRATGYFAVAANSSFTLNAAGSPTTLLSIPANLMANTVYTIYITGSSQSNLSYHVVTHSTALQ